VAGHQGLALRAEVNRLQRSVTRRLNDWRNVQWRATLESLDPEDQSLWRMTKRVMRVPNPSPLGRPEGIALSESEKAEALTENLETQLPTVTDSSVPAVIEMFEVELRFYFLPPASEPKLRTPDEVQEAIRGLKFSNAPGPNGIPNRALKHFPQRAVSLLAMIFIAVLTHHFPTVRKHTRMISILKTVKDLALPSSYRPSSILDTIGKLFEKILLARILHEVNEGGLMRDEQFRPRRSTSLQLAHLVERMTRNLGEKMRTVAVFLDVAKAFDTVWIDDLLYKLALLNFPSYIVHTSHIFGVGRSIQSISIQSI
jgi:hypothetical protein